MAVNKPVTKFDFWTASLRLALGRTERPEAGSKIEISCIRPFSKESLPRCMYRFQALRSLFTAWSSPELDAKRDSAKPETIGIRPSALKPNFSRQVPPGAEAPKTLIPTFPIWKKTLL